MRKARAPKLGPTPVEDVKFLMDDLGLKNLFGCSGIRTYGWLEGGYTYASTGPGRLATEPRENRFGNEFLLNQMGIVLEKPLDSEVPVLGLQHHLLGRRRPVR